MLDGQLFLSQYVIFFVGPSHSEPDEFSNERSIFHKQKYPCGSLTFITP
jgi:hypothetical protein